MWRFIGKRLLRVAIVLIGIVTVTFFLSRTVGDPVRLMIPINASEETYQSVRRDLGLDQPLIVQYWNYVSDLARGQFGTSYWQQAPAMPLVLSRVPATLQLATAAMAIGVLVGGLLGILGGLRPRSLFGRLTNVIASTAYAVPDFWFGILLIVVFSVNLGWFPTSGYGGLAYLVLPAVTLSLRPLGRIASLVRDAVVEEMARPYMVAARARGLRTPQLVMRHLMRNIQPAVITLAGFDFIMIFTGYAVGVEMVFQWPGLGKLAVDAVLRQDAVLISAIVLFTGVLVAVGNAVLDIAHAAIDPRVDL